MAQFRKSYVPALLSGIAGIVIFAVALGGTYIYDDTLVILRDPRVRNPQYWHYFWTRPYNSGPENLFRPLASMSYALQWWLHQDRAWAFHLINILLHAGVCAAVAELARRMAGSKAALVAGLLFAVHPIHAEVAANIAGRPEMMCALGILGAILLLQKPLTYSRAFAITGCAILAMLSKEQGLLCPLIILGFYVSQRLLRNSATLPALESPAIRRDAPKLLGFLLCASLAAYIVWRESHVRMWFDRDFLDWSSNPMVQNRYNPSGGTTGIQLLLLPLAILGRYVALLVAPVKLSIDYGSNIIGWRTEWNNAYLWIGIVSLLGWIAAAGFAIVKRNSAALFLLLATALTYGMIGNIVATIGTIFGERLIYIPSAFIAILIGMAATKVPNKVLVSVGSILLVLGSVRTVSYAAKWNDRLSFYEYSVKQQPGSARLRIILADEYRARGQVEKAQQINADAQAILPEFSEVWIQAGKIALELKQTELAGKYFAKAMELQPTERAATGLQLVPQTQPATTSRE